MFASGFGFNPFPLKIRGSPPNENSESVVMIIRVNFLSLLPRLRGRALPLLWLLLPRRLLLLLLLCL